MNISQVNVGDKVHYVPYRGCDKRLLENGIVKEKPDHTTEAVRVVYHCAGDWSRYRDYTSALTRLEDLRAGWIFGTAGEV